MSNSATIAGRARVVYCCPEFLHLAKGGLDGKIVAYKDSWISKSFEIQDWVTFKAKAHEPEGTHVTFGVRYKAIPSSVSFESKGKIIDGVGTLMKVDDAKGQYGFITANDRSTVYFTASVVRPDTNDIRKVFKTGMQIRYRATEQKQNQVQWRAIAVCNKNACIDVLTGRQPKSIDAVIGNRTIVGLPPKKPLQPTVASNNICLNNISNSSAKSPTQVIAPPMKQEQQHQQPQNVLPAPIGPPSPGGVHSSLSGSVLSNSIGSRSSSSGSRPGSPPGLFGSSSPTQLSIGQATSPLPFSSSNSLDDMMPPVVFPTSLPPTQADIPFPEVPTTGDAYEDAVRRLAYFAHCISESSCNYCLFR